MPKRKSQDLPKKVYLTLEAHNQLREMKKTLKKSMAQIVIDLVNEKYESLSTGQSKALQKQEVERTPKKTYGNQEINWVLETFEQMTGHPSAGRKKQDRFCAKHLLNNYNQDQIKAMIWFFLNHKYAPRVGSVEQLWYKRDSIIAGIRDLKKNKQESKLIEI